MSDAVRAQAASSEYVQAKDPSADFQLRVNQGCGFRTVGVGWDVLAEEDFDLVGIIIRLNASVTLTEDDCLVLLPIPKA